MDYYVKNTCMSLFSAQAMIQIPIYIFHSGVVEEMAEELRGWHAMPLQSYEYG